MRFTIASSLLLGAQLAYTVPAPQSFVLQGDAALNLPAVDAELPRMPELSVEDFINVESVKTKIEDAYSTFVQKVDEAERATTWPDHPPPEIDFSQYTILEIVNASLHSHHRCGHHHGDKDGEHEKKPDGWRLPWSHHGDGDKEHEHDPKHLPLGRLAWLVNHSTDAQELLKREGITLLAPDNMALTPPEHRRPRGPHHSAESIAEAIQVEQEAQPVAHPFHEMVKSHKDKDGDHHDDDKDRGERRRRFFNKVVGYVLSYHTIPEVRDARSLVDASTVATSVESSRLKVEAALAVFPHPYPTVKFNGYAYKRGPTIKAKNGIIHLIGAPLLPPLSPLNQLFLFPQAFSTLTSGLQKVDLADGLLPHWSGDKSETQESGAFEENEMVQSVIDELLGEHRDAGTFTVFAPSNFAFSRLGPKVVAFLHSPFPISRAALKYVLSYHVVPDIAFFSDFIRNDTSKATAHVESTEVHAPIPSEWIEEHTPQHGNITHYRLPTLLSTSEHGNKNATLHVVTIEYHYLGQGPLKRAIVVLPHEAHNEHERAAAKPVRVFKTDGPARNGAIQWIVDLLPPPWPQHHEEHKHSAHQKRMHNLVQGLMA